MKVLVDGRPSAGGIARYTQELIRMLRNELGSERVAVYRERDTASPRGVDRSAIRRVAGTVGGRLRRVVGDHLGLPLEAQRVGATIVHCPAGLAPIGDIPAVITCHDLSLIDRFGGYKPGPMKYYERHGLLRSIESAAHVVTLTATVAAELRRRFGLSAERVTPIAPPLADLPAPGSGALPADLGQFILCVAVLEPRKNLAALIAAHRAAWPQIGRPLVLIGPYGWSQRSVLTAVEQSGGRVRWLGSVDDATLADAYSRADAVVQYSLDEGFDYPAVEALGFGAPLILSDIPVHREVAGDCAVYASPAEPAALAERLREVTAWTAGERVIHVGRARDRIAEIRALGAVRAYIEIYQRVDEARGMHLSHRRSGRERRS